MLIHKIQIAKRQIEAAADLFFGNGDPLAVVTLAGAAEEILGNIIRRRGDEAMLDHLVSLDRRLTGGRDYSVVIKEVNGVRNALKHAKDPDDDEVEVPDGEAIAMLSRALVNYVLVGEQPTEGMHRIYTRLVSTHLDVAD